MCYCMLSKWLTCQKYLVGSRRGVVAEESRSDHSSSVPKWSKCQGYSPANTKGAKRPSSTGTQTAPGSAETGSPAATICGRVPSSPQPAGHSAHHWRSSGESFAPSPRRCNHHHPDETEVGHERWAYTFTHLCTHTPGWVSQSCSVQAMPTGSPLGRQAATLSGAGSEKLALSPDNLSSQEKRCDEGRICWNCKEIPGPEMWMTKKKKAIRKEQVCLDWEMKPPHSETPSRKEEPLWLSAAGLRDAFQERFTHEQQQRKGARGKLSSTWKNCAFHAQAVQVKASPPGWCLAKLSQGSTQRLLNGDWNVVFGAGRSRDNEPVSSPCGRGRAIWKCVSTAEAHSPSSAGHGCWKTQARSLMP